MFQSMAQSSISTLYSCELFTSEIVFIQGALQINLQCNLKYIQNATYNVHCTLYIQEKVIPRSSELTPKGHVNILSDVIFTGFNQ